MKRGLRNFRSGRFLPCIGAGAILLWLAPGVLAHEPGQSYLALRVENSRIHGQVDIALRDLEQAVGLDANDDGKITWGELLARHDEIAAYVIARLSIRSGDKDCPVRPLLHLVDRHHHAGFAVMRFVAECPGTADAPEVTYRLLFDVDPQHRGLLRLVNRGRAVSGVFSADHPTWSSGERGDARSRGPGAINK